MARLIDSLFQQLSKRLRARQHLRNRSLHTESKEDVPDRLGDIGVGSTGKPWLGDMRLAGRLLWGRLEQIERREQNRIYQLRIFELTQKSIRSGLTLSTSQTIPSLLGAEGFGTAGGK